LENLCDRLFRRVGYGGRRYGGRRHGGRGCVVASFGFQGARFEVIKATNLGITYRVLKHLD